MQKPVISYWKDSDPTKKLAVLYSRLTEINIINTKNLTPQFNQFCLANKDKLYLHIVINGMGGSILEPNIPPVKHMFEGIKHLIVNGFPANRILLVVDPILPNQNGIAALKLLLRVFTEHKDMKMRRIRFKLLPYYKNEAGKYMVANRNLAKRKFGVYSVEQYTTHMGAEFWNQYNQIKQQYHGIIEIDDNNEALIGVRELITFGLNNTWTDGSKLITYEKNDKQKPIVNIISEKNPTRCSNRCALCPYKG